MATYATLTVPVVDIIGANFNASRASVWIEPNVPVVLADNIRVGGRREQVINGVATFTNLVTTNSADNPTSFGYRITITAPPKGAQKREDIVTLTTSDFPFTATGSLKDISAAWDNIALPAAWRSDFRDEMGGVLTEAEAARDLARDISNIDTSDTAINTALQLPGGLSAQRIADTIAASATNSTRAFLKKLKRNAEDATILHIGDSTGNDASDWPRVHAGLLAAKWPTHSFDYATFDPAGTAHWNTPGVITTGTGPRAVHIKNASIAGWDAVSFLAPNFDLMIANTQPDLVFIALGHNENAVDADFEARYAALTESIAAACPKADIICVAQNPNQTDDTQALKAQRIEQWCAVRGYGFIDIHQLFKDRGDYSDWMQDALHPNALGQQATADEILKAFTYSRGAKGAPRQPSTLSVSTENLIRNGDFSSFAGAVPDSWTTLDCTVTKDATDYESPNGYSIVLTDAGAASKSYIEQSLPAELVRGSWVTVSARVKIGATQPYSAGAVELGDYAAGYTRSVGESSDHGKGGWRWETVTRFIPENADRPYVRIHADHTSVTSGVARVDRVTVSRGIFPRDFLFGAGSSNGYVRKTANTVRNNTTAVVDDPHLVLPLAANASYTFEAVLFANSASGTPDLRLAFGWPADAAGIFGDIALTTAATSQGGSIITGVAEASGAMPAGSTVGLVAGKTMILLKGHIRTVTAGTLALRWAQGTATVEDTTLYADSHLTLTRRS